MAKCDAKGDVRQNCDLEFGTQQLGGTDLHKNTCACPWQQGGEEGKQGMSSSVGACWKRYGAGWWRRERHESDETSLRDALFHHGWSATPALCISGCAPAPEHPHLQQRHLHIHQVRVALQDIPSQTQQFPRTPLQPQARERTIPHL